MFIIHKRRKILGREDNTFIAIESAKVIKSDLRELAEMDSESIKKSEEQRKNEVGIGAIAHDMVACGIYDDVANGPVLTKKRRF